MTSPIKVEPLIMDFNLDDIARSFVQIVSEIGPYSIAYPKANLYYEVDEPKQQGYRDESWKISVSGKVIYLDDDIDDIRLTLFGSPESYTKLVEIDLFRIHNTRTAVTPLCLNTVAEEYFLKLLELFGEYFPEIKDKLPSVPKVALQDDSPNAATRKETKPPGPTQRTRDRVEIFKELKDKNPTWSQAKVAMEANFNEGAENYTADTVKNAFKAMGWTWERADRIR